MEIGVLLQLADRMPLDVLERFASERLLAHARFRHTVIEPAFYPLRPRWRAERAFDLTAHVRALADTDVGSEEQLARLVSARLSERMGFARSPWSLELVPTQGASALLFRVHHCIADGLALVRLLCELSDEPRPARHELPVVHDRLAPRLEARLRAAAGKTRQLATDMLRLAASRADDAPQVHAVSGMKRVAWSSAFELARVTHTAALHGCHATDLLLSAAADAVARGLRCAQRPVSNPLRALVPFGGTVGPGELGNHYASVFVDLPLDEPDAWRRCRRIALATNKLRDPAQTRLALALMGVAGLLAPPLARRAIDFMSQRASLVLSNVPGPAAPVYLMGHEVRSIVVFAPPSASVGMSFTLFGYAGKLRLGVETDAAMPLRPEQLVRDFEAALLAHLP